MNSKDRRALFLGLAVLVPALGYIWGLKPLRAWHADLRDQVTQQQLLLANERAAVSAAKKNPEAQRVADSAMRAMEPRLFEGSDPFVASAELVSHLTQIAQRANVSLTTASTRPATSANGVRTLRVEIRAESDITGLLAFLESIENGEKLLKVERLDVSRSLAAAEVKGVEPIAISAAIAGYALGDPNVPDTPPARGAKLPASSAPARGGAR